MKHLTPRQKEVLEFIRDFIEEEGQAPSHSEIQRGIDIRGKSAVAKHLAALEKKKKIMIKPRRERGITLVA